MPRTPAPLLYAQLLVASLRPADPSPTSRAPARDVETELSVSETPTSFMGVSFEEMRELADRLPQEHHQYDSKTPIDPKLIEESMSLGHRDANPGSEEGYTYDKLESFEKRMADRRAGTGVRFVSRLRLPPRVYGEELTAEELGLKR